MPVSQTPQPPEIEYKPTVVTLTRNPLLRDKMHETVLAHHARSIVAIDANEFLIAVDGYFPVLILIDLTAEQPTNERNNVDSDGDNNATKEQNSLSGLQLIERCKLLPHNRSITVVALGGSKEIQQQARQAGANLVLTQAEFLAQISQLIDQHINLPIRYVEGWNGSLSADARKGLEEFNRGEYFEQHELLEAAWNAEPRAIRELYQGILQIGVALLQIERDNWAGAIKLFRRGLPKLRGLPATCQGIDLADFLTKAEKIHHEIVILGPDKLKDFDQARFPKINFE